MNPVQKLLDAGIPRQTIIEKTKLSDVEISYLINDKRNPSWRHRKAFKDAFGIDVEDWDKE